MIVMTHSDPIPPITPQGRGELPDQMLSALQINFPSWRPEAFTAVANIMGELRGVFLVDKPEVESRQTAVEGEVIRFALAAGKKNIAAVIGSITQPSPYTTAEAELSPNLLTALGYSQSLLVDFSDHLSEGFIGSETDDQETVERRFRQGMGLYRKLAAIVAPDDFHDNYQDADSHFNLSEEFTIKLKKASDKLGDAFDSIFGSDENSLLARKMCAKIIMNYGACVELMHIRNDVERERLFHSLVENKADYASQMGIDFFSLPEWLEGNPHGYMYFGSPMLAYAIIEAAASDKLGHIGYLENLQRYYELVPFLHVFLDGVADDKVDFASGNFAPNLARLIASGEVAGFLQAEIEGETQQKSKAFVRYLLEGIKEMKGTVHLQIIKDLLKFYQLELARNPAKDDNVLANELLDYMATQLASI